jgi:acid phosphatase (class A)
MKRILPTLFLLLVTTLSALGADLHFLDPSTVVVTDLLPPPPAAGSAAAAADMDAVLKAQITRSDAEVIRGKSEAKLTPAAFQAVFGTDFTAQNFPHTFALLDDAEKDSKVFSAKAKEIFARPRPKFVDFHVRPAVEGDDEPSYPSGHATRAMLTARILCEIAPDKKHELLDRAEEIGWDRVVIGVHYPSDIYAGEVLGQALAQAMSKNPDFESRLAEAKQEFHSASTAQPVAVGAIH